MDIFRSASDYEVYIHTLREATLREPIKIHAYVLMTNHVHLIVTPGSAAALARAMQAVGRRYVRFFNDQYERTGGLFEGRYKAFAIDTEDYWFTCMRYVEFNPIRAGLAASPDAYRWSSYSTHAFGKENLLLSPHPLYLALGAAPEERQRCWRTLCGTPLTDDQVAQIRTRINASRPLRADPSQKSDAGNLESPRSGV